MNRRYILLSLLLVGLLIGSLFLIPRIPSAFAQQKPDKNPNTEEKLSDQVMRQIEALSEEKASRTLAQQKLDSQLLYAVKMNRNEAIAKGVERLETNVKVDAEGLTLVDIDGAVSGEVLDKIERLGGQVVNKFKEYNTIRARLPLGGIEELAALDAIKFIRPADQPQLENPALPDSGADQPIGKATVVNPIRAGTSRPANFAARATTVRAQMAKICPAC